MYHSHHHYHKTHEDINSTSGQNGNRLVQKVSPWSFSFLLPAPPDRTVSIRNMNSSKCGSLTRLEFLQNQWVGPKKKKRRKKKLFKWVILVKHNCSGQDYWNTLNSSWNIKIPKLTPQKHKSCQNGIPNTQFNYIMPTLPCIRNPIMTVLLPLLSESLSSHMGENPDADAVIIDHERSGENLFQYSREKKKKKMYH